MTVIHAKMNHSLNVLEKKSASCVFFNVPPV